MQAGSLVSGDLLGLTTRVLVNGAEHKHRTWSIDRDLDGDLPAQVVAGSGIKQATGTIEWAAEDDLEGRSANPWNAGAGWLPAQGDRVIIYVSDGVTEWPQFVGVIDETKGSAGSSGASSTIVDYIDYLNRPISHPAVLRVHPPKTEGGDYIGVGMFAGYAVDRALRACGFYATSAIEPGVVLSVPAQMSMWPERGTITAGASYDGIASHLETHQTSWGRAAGDFNCSYTPTAALARTAPLHMTVRVAAEHDGNLFFSSYYGTQRIQIGVTQSRTVYARLGTTDVCSLTLEAAATTVTLLIKNGQWTIKTNVGATVTGTAAIPAGDPLSSIVIAGDNLARVAGFQVSSPPAGQEFQSLATVASYYQEIQAFAGLMDVMPSYVNRPAIDVLTEISKATLTAMWFAENGQLRLIGSDVLRAQDVAQTVTTLDDVFDLEWEDSRLGMRSSVAVKYRLPIVAKSRYSNITLWQGSGESMGSGQEKFLIAQAPDSEDWAEIDLGIVGTDEGNAAFNSGRGTWVGGYLEDSAGAESSATGYATYAPIASLDERTRLFGVTTGTLPAGKTYVLATSDNPAYFPRFRGFDFPVLRGRAKVVWTDATIASATTGPYGFPALEHDAGPWVSRTDSTLVVTRLADFIAAAVTTPAPLINGLRVQYDPRRQLGDVIRISSQDLLGVDITALIVGVRNKAAETFTQSLSVRVISATTAYTSYGEFEEAHADTLTYEQWRLLFPDTATYATFNAEPLKGA